MRSIFMIGRAVAAAVALALHPLAPAFAWGDLGHQAIGEAAATSPRLTKDAREAIRKILGNTDLAAVAVWPDQLREAQRRNKGPLANDPEAKAFIKNFPDNPNWHFVNLPLETVKHEDAGKFSAPKNIVIQIKYCIDVLEGKKSPMTKRQALRWLVHLAGDVHQPLHVGIGFFKINPATNDVELVRDPSKVTPGLFNDRGGNQLYFSQTQYLHSFWDGTLVQSILPGKDTYQELAKHLLSRIAKEESNWSQSGNYKTWPDQWAMDTVKEANKAYDAAIVYGKFQPASKDNNGETVPAIIRITLPQNYQTDQQDRATAQLAKAAYRLTDLFNRIAWKE